MSNDHSHGRSGPTDSLSGLGAHSRGRHVLSTVLTLAAVAAAAIGGSAVVAAPAIAEQPWGFEKVTPDDKGGAAVHSEFSTARPGPDGNSLFYAARSPLEGAPTDYGPVLTRYVARRGAERWESKGTDAPTRPHYWIASTGTHATSTNLAYAIVTSMRALTPGATEGGGNIYIRDTATGAYTLIATHPDKMLVNTIESHPSSNLVTYVADDGRSAVFHTQGQALTPEAEAAGATHGLYKWTADDGLEIVSVLPRSEGGRPTNGLGIGTEGNGPRDPFPTDPRALDHIYFQAYETGAVYVRSGNETRLVSVSQRAGDPDTPVPAYPQAVSAAGRYVLFTADDGMPLTEDAPLLGGGRSLYRYDLEQDLIEYIGASLHYGNGAVIQMSRDGQTIAFTHVVFSPEYGTEFKVWRRGRTRLVHRVEGDVRAASVSGIPRLLSPNGRYLLLVLDSRSAAERVGAVPRGPESNCRSTEGAPGDFPCYQVYRFDADEPSDDAAFICVSCRRDGRAPLTDSFDPAAEAVTGSNYYDHRQAQNVLDDGTVFFGSLDPLVPEDTNSQTDAYAFRDGRYQLLSRAAIGTVSRFLDATPDGKTVFIASNDQLVPTDTDRSFDIYMTRPGAGYPVSDVAAPPPCEATCRDASAGGSVSPLPALASIGFAGAGNVADGSVPVRLRRPVVSKVRAVRGAKGVLRVRVAGRGSLWLSGRGLVSASRRTARAGTFRLAARLTRGGRRALRKRGSVMRRARVSFVSETGDTTSVNVSLKFKAPGAGRKGGK